MKNRKIYIKSAIIIVTILVVFTFLSGIDIHKNISTNINMQESAYTPEWVFLPTEMETPEITDTPSAYVNIPTETAVVTSANTPVKTPVRTPNGTNIRTPVVTSTVNITNTPNTVKPVQTPEMDEIRLIDKLSLQDSVKQVILVTNEKLTDTSATVELYEKNESGIWKSLRKMNGLIGENGFVEKATEGESRTPMGIFGILFIFGNNDDPGIDKGFEYKKLQKGDIWISNMNILEEYNVMINYSGTIEEARRRFGIVENLTNIEEYSYAAVLDYNYGAEKVLGRGSAFFLHEDKSSDPTAGCVAIKQSDLLYTLKWLRKSSDPHIVMGTTEYLSKNNANK